MPGELELGKIYNALEKTYKPKQKESDTITSSVPIEINDKNKSVEFYDDSQSENISVQENIAHNLVTILEPYSVVSEQFRLLKNNILFPEKGQPPRTIMVTSPSPNEGKSFIAANLAASIAQSIDEYVLLMDCDLRSPSIHSLFGFKGSQKGLSDYLSDRIDLPSVLKKTTINKLTILPAGKIPRNPSELLSSEQMRRMLHEVKLRYNDRYIIIDTPPPYITSETNAIARYVDGIIVVVRHGKTRMKEIKDIVDIYGKENILGVVSNFSKKGIGYGYRYHKYGYGYKQ